MQSTRNFFFVLRLLVCLGVLSSLPVTAQTVLAPGWGVVTVAGTGGIASATTAWTDGGLATATVLGDTDAATVDGRGNVYISDTTRAIILKVTADTGIITRIAGVPGAAGQNGDGPALTAMLSTSVYCLAMDKDGNLLIADAGNSAIRKLYLSGPNVGNLVTVAGVLGSSGVGGGTTATTTELHLPYGVAGDAAGNIYIADYDNYVIRKVAPSGDISVIAGKLGVPGGLNSTPISATTATLNHPYGVWVDPSGNVIIADSTNNAVREVYAAGPNAGNIVTIAGNGTAGTTASAAGNNIPATTAELNTPHNAVMDGQGNLYICDEDTHTIRMVNTAGIITTIAGVLASSGSATTTGALGTSTKLDFPYQIAINPVTGDLIVANPIARNVQKLTRNLTTTAQQTLTPIGTAGITSNLYVMNPSTTTAVIPETAAVPPASSQEFALGGLSGCALGNSFAAQATCTVPVTFTPVLPGLRTSQLLFTDSTGLKSAIGIYGIGSAPQASFGLAGITTVVGTGAAGNGVGQVSAPRGGVVDSAGNIYFADSGNNVIRKISAGTGAVSIVAGTGAIGNGGDGASATSAMLNAPASIALDAAGNLYIADTGNNSIRFVDATTGNISTIAGGGTVCTNALDPLGDGCPATQATLNAPQGVAVGLAGQVYVADTGNNIIRSFSEGGLIAAVAGTGTAGYSGDGAAAVAAELNAPQAVRVDPQGDVYIADTGNDVIRVIASPTNNLSTFAGQQGQATNTGDGSTATGATLSQPSDIAVDAAGNVYIAAGGQIRVVLNSSNIITTVAGTGMSGSYSGEGGLATAAVIPTPASNLMLDGSANIYLSATAANRILKVSAATPPALNLGFASPGTTGAAEPISIVNTGNSALNLAGLAVSNGFVLLPSGGNDCTATASITPGAACAISVALSPLSGANGNITGTITLTDNTLNGAAVTQVISLSGTAKLLANTTTALNAMPAVLVYGGQATVTATVSSSIEATGTVSFTVNGVAAGSIPISNNRATLTIQSLPVTGPETIVAQYSGDSNNNPSSATLNETIQPAVLTVTANSASISWGGALPTFTYTITGFVGGDPASVIAGVPAESTTATSAMVSGTYPVTISKGTLSAANYTFTFLNGTLTIGTEPPADFNFSATPPVQTVAAGNATYYTVSLTPLYGYAGTPNISCTGLPKNTSCFITGSFTTAGTGNPLWTQVEIRTTGSSSSNVSEVETHETKHVWFGMMLPLCFAGVALGNRKRIGMVRLLSVMLLSVMALGMTSCSGGTSSTVLASTGSYQVTLTATDTAAKLSHASTVTLTIQ